MMTPDQRARMDAGDILTKVRPADRIPSVGVQLAIAPEEPCAVCDRVDDRCRFGAPRLCSCWRGTPCGIARPSPERLTLWDQPADLWSTDR